MGFSVSGLLPAFVTSIGDDGRVAPEAAGPLVDYYVERGADGLYILGFTGEGAYLDVAQREQWAAATIEAARRRIPVLVHVGYAGEAAALELAAHAASAGADAISSVNLPGNDRLEDNVGYFERLAKVSGLPFYIYWNRAVVAGPEGRRVEARELVDRMTLIPGFAGIKYTDSDFYYLQRIKKYGPSVNVLTGMDAMCLAGGLMGSDGSIGALQAATCRHMKTMWERFLAGDLAEASRLQATANDVYELVNRPGAGVMPSIKALLRHLGLPAGRVAPRSGEKELGEAMAEELFACFDERILK
jgi:dihydrodipicolinate synthase/N-acetylneuraminate lyase